MRATPPYAEGVSSGLRDRIAAVIATGVTEPPTPRPARLRFRRFDLVFVADVVTALICFAATNSSLGNQNARHGSHHSIEELVLVSLALCAPLVLRTRFPLTAWTASAVAMFWASRLIPPHTLSSATYIPAGVIVYVLCLYAVAVRCKAWVVTGAGIVTVLAAAYIDWQSTTSALFAAAIPVFAGVIVRSRRGSREQLAVAERRHEGERALLEERQRIARELHDVVAHTLAVITVQAGVGRRLMAKRPEEAGAALESIEMVGRTAQDELRVVLGLLREEDAGAAALAPAPRLVDLKELVDTVRASGTPVELRTSGTDRQLSPALELTLYRVVQEALTNVVRHAPRARATVDLTVSAAQVRLEVADDGGSARRTAGDQERPDIPGTGHGIVGMRERIGAFGGWLVAEPLACGFRVLAEVPIEGAM